MPIADNRMTPEQRRRAIAAILARGVRRLLEGAASVTDNEERPGSDRPRRDAKTPISGDAGSS